MFIYAANWKMCMSFDEAIAFCKNNYKDFVILSKLKGKQVLLLPEFTQIKSVHDIFAKTDVLVGAQDCASIESGKFTGQVSVLSLKQIGCQYCIVGHSEAFINCVDCLSRGDCSGCLGRNAEIAQKVLLLCQAGITPILCVGESRQDFLADNTESVIKNELELVFDAIKSDNLAVKLSGKSCNDGQIELCIAYEPIWAIGSGVTPEIGHIDKVFDLILQISRKFRLENKIKLMYGGSVDENNAKNLKNIQNLSGFLIGSASLDFKNFKKIVEL